MRYTLMNIMSIFFITPLYAIETHFAGTTYSRIADQQNSQHVQALLPISLYGHLQIGNRVDMIAHSFQHRIASSLVNQWTTGTATITHTTPLATVSTGTDTTITTSLVSKSHIYYTPGHEVFSEFTANYVRTSTSGTTTQYIGLLSEKDGFAIGYQNDSFGILHRRNGSQVSFISQANFNIDPLDGTGPSGFILDQTKLNTYSIHYGWLGVAPILYSVMREDGKWITFHKIQYAGTNTTTHTVNPSLPIAIELSKSSSDATNLEVNCFALHGGLIGNSQSLRNNTYSINDITIDGTTDQHAFTLRNKQIFQSKTNAAKASLLYIEAYGLEGNNILNIKVVKNATITSPSFTDIESNLSTIEVSTTGSISGGDILFYNNSYTQTHKGVPLLTNNIFFDIYPGETLSFMLSEYGGGIITATVIVTWKEFY